MTAKGYHKRTLERPYGLEMAVEVEKGWEMNPRAPIILGIIKPVLAIRFQCNHPPKLERGHHRRLLTYQLTYFSTEFTLELSNPPLWQLLFPTISPLEGNFNPYVSDPFTPNTSHCYIERAGRESGKFQSFFHFLVLPPQFPLPSLCGPGLFLWPAINHLHPKGCNWILCSQLRIFLWVCNLANTVSYKMEIQTYLL